MNELERAANKTQQDIIRELRDQGKIGIFDFAENVPSIPLALRFGDIVIEPDGDTYCT